MWQGRGIRAPESVPWITVQLEQDCRPHTAGVAMITRGLASPTGIDCSSTIRSTKPWGPPRWSGSVYHFTVGGPVEDLRLTTLPAYGSEVDR